MYIDELKEKALSLPLLPGVYIMRNKAGAVIYVGKAKKLKNRVSQYFQNMSSHSPKTRVMVSNVHNFDVIVADSEFEALVLECSLIKQYKPKYNILLKDDKGYPFVRLSKNDLYPRFTVVSEISDDGAEYYGPFGSRGVTLSLLKALNLALKLPDCTRKLPADIGKQRPCLNYHLNQCTGWCMAERSAEEYRSVVEQGRQLLLGNYKSVTANIRTEMQAAAEALNFELAASLRDRLQAVETLGKKQLVTGATSVDTDVIGYAQSAEKACFSVLHFCDGKLIDKESVIVTAQEDDSAATSALLKQFYLSRRFTPKEILLPFDIDDHELVEQLFLQEFGKRVKLRVPKRGDNVRLVALSVKNARDELDRNIDRDMRLHSTLHTLSKMISVEDLSRIESYDISNISGTDTVASMVVFSDGKPTPSQYKRFKIEDLPGQDDYSAMRQVLQRRFQRYLQQDSGFDVLPQLLLIDGGIAHTKVALDVLADFNLFVPVFGMVKDNRHRTRALVTADGKEIGIFANQGVFSLIGRIQEETHKFAINYHKKLRSRRLRYSELDGIPGVGPKRKELLLKTFKSLSGIAATSVSELEHLLPKDVAFAVYRHFRKNQEGENQ